MREADNIREVERLRIGDGTSGMAQGIDLMGFIFWPKSKRYVAEPPSYLPERAKKVGVFVDASLEDIRQHIEDCDPPESFKGLPITLISAGIVSISFFGFAGIVENLFG